MNDKREEQPQEAASAESQSVEVRLGPDYRTTSPIIYSNTAFVSHTANDLCVDFCLISPPHNLSVERGTLTVPVVTRVIIPSGMVEGLIKALNVQVEAQRKERDEGRTTIVGLPIEGGIHE